MVVVMANSTVWSLLFAIMSGNQVPIPELMESNTVSNLDHCVKMANVKWNDYYQWNPPNTHFYTYCLEFRDRDRYTRLIAVKCSREGDCTMKGIKSE
jgi:hypothetical protein